MEIIVFPLDARHVSTLADQCCAPPVWAYTPGFSDLQAKIRMERGQKYFV
jgi:hypothetical protein